MREKRSLQSMYVANDPRKQVIDDIILEIQNHMNNGDFVVLMSDLNENVNSHEKINDRFKQMGLINVMQNRLGTNELPHTHKCGSSAIDHIWISASLMDLYLDEVLDANIFTMQPVKHRRLKATIPKRVNKYLDVLGEKWEDQNIDGRFSKLLHKIETNSIDDLPYETNKIDKSISEIMRHAEKKCCSLPSTNILHWSPTLKNSLDGLRKCSITRTKLQYIQPNQTLREAIKKYT